MFNLGDDNELDRFSREAAGKYSPPGEPNWEKLSEELDKVLPVEEKKRRFIFFWWLLPVLLLGGAVTYWLESKNEKKQSFEVVTNSKESESNTPAHAIPALGEKTASSATPHNTQTTKEANTFAKPSDKISGLTSPLSKQSNQAEKMLAATKPGKKRSIAANEWEKDLSIIKTKIVSLPKPVLPAVNDATTITSNLINTESITNKPSVTTQEQNKMDTKSKQEDLSTEKNIGSAAETIITKKEESIEPQTKKESVDVITTANEKNAGNKVTSLKKNRGFSYSFVAGVDKSTVKFRYGFDPGYNFGVMAGYHFNSKWSVHTGAIYTKKNYKLDGVDFTAPKGTPVSYYKLDLVDGYCKMWEVPLLMRYTIPKTKANSLFLSAGLSSYFMTNEDYNYYYKYLGMPVVKNASYNSTDTHILSIVHLSAGFSKAISKTWDMQLEPYAKIPLGGVGFGSIELSSFGVNFSLQHRQLLKK